MSQIIGILSQTIESHCTNNGYLFVGCLDDVPGEVLRDSLGDDGDGLEGGLVHGVHGHVVGGSERGEVDHDVGVRVLGGRLARHLVD